ncbi:MAG: GLPGLI family protein, partial [Prevotella sp.]|nr:GLPGLI family protein [Prevotella sp.]
YACSERIEEPQWTLLSDSLTEIIGYSCHLATTTYRGRKWFAWYTDDIPLSYGPWKLAGLPGLILRAYDDEHQYQFETTGLKQYDASAKIPIDYKGTEYEEIEKATLNKQYERYYADPVGFVSNNPNVQVVVKDEHGNPTKMNGIPYNPIER